MATTSHGIKDGQVKISKRVEKELHNTKVVVRRLPPDMTEKKLLEIFLDIPQYSYFYFAAGDSSLGDLASSRAYFSFIDEASIVPFRDEYDGLLFESVKGHKYHAVIEFSPYQGIPKRSKKKADSRLATIEQDADYQMFLETLDVKKDPPTMAELSAYVDSLSASKAPEVQKTPLIEYLTENHRRGGRTSKRSKPVGDLKRRSKDSSRATKESRYSTEDGTNDSGGSKEWGSGKTKKEPSEKCAMKSETNDSSHSTAFSSSAAASKWLGSSSDRSKEKERGSREGGRGWKEEGWEGGGWTERNGEGRREGRGERGRKGGRGGRKEVAEGWGVRSDGGRKDGGDREGGSGYREKRSKQSGEVEGKAKEYSIKNKDRPDQAIYSRGKSRRDYNHPSSNEGCTEVKKGAKEWEEGSHGTSNRSEGLKKREHVNGEKIRSRSGGWDEYGGRSGGKGWKHEGGGGGRRGRNRDAYHESTSSYHDK